MKEGSRKLSSMQGSSVHSGSNMSSSAVVESHRRSQMEVFRKKFGEYGEPYGVGEYKEFNMYFDNGEPTMFWLHADTKALSELHRYIQKTMRKKSGGDGGGVGVEEGSLVLAKYKVDQAMYRARVEEVVVGKNGEGEMFSVRYIDYGNRGESLTHADIYTREDSMFSAKEEVLAMPLPPELACGR